MAQTGFTPIQIYSSSTAAAAPVAGSLTNSALGSELAINITDGKLFYKDNANAIQVIGWKVVPATAGGTGQTSYAVGDILYADTTTSLAKLADVATGNALISGGVGVAPAWGKIGLTTHVSGTLPVANGGTGTATAFTAGSVVFAGASGVYSQNNANFFWDNTNIRLGLNNSAPTATLEIGTAASTGRFIQVNGSNADASYIVLKGTKQFPRIDLEDNSAGGSTFQIWNLGNQLRVGTNPGSSTLSAFNVSAGNAGNVSFNGSMGIASGLAIGNGTPPGAIFAIGGSVLSSGAGTHFLKWSNVTGNVTYDTSSRLVKQDIVDSPYGLSEILKLKPRKYFRTDDQRIEHGLIADEVVDVMPEYVPIVPKSLLTKNEEDTELVPGGVNYERIVAPLINAIHELSAQIDALKLQIGK
jgi:hypothetical protein